MTLMRGSVSGGLRVLIVNSRSWGNPSLPMGIISNSLLIWLMTSTIWAGSVRIRSSAFITWPVMFAHYPQRVAGATVACLNDIGKTGVERSTFRDVGSSRYFIPFNVRRWNFRILRGDMGLLRLLSLSDGTLIDNPH